MLSKKIALIAASVRMSARREWTSRNVEELAGLLSIMAAEAAALEAQTEERPLQIDDARSIAEVCRRIVSTHEHVTQDQARTLAAYLLTLEARTVAA